MSIRAAGRAVQAPGAWHLGARPGNDLSMDVQAPTQWVRISKVDRLTMQTFRV